MPTRFSTSRTCRDIAGIYLCQGDEGGRAHGCGPPENYAWAYEMEVEDPDGHVLRFG